MTADMTAIAIIAGASLAGLAIAVAASLKGWRDWLAYKKLELARDRGDPVAPEVPAGGRIELADLRERVRKLEAIAAGIDL